MIRASGNPRKSMAIMLTSVGVNLILNPLFIFKFGWGIKGSAAATVIAQFVACLIALSHFCSKSSFLRFKREAFHFDLKIVGNILSIGLAPFLMNLCASMVAAFVNTAMLRYGGTGMHDIITREQGAADLYVGAYGIVNRVALLFIMIIQGLNQGMQPIVGYNYGAKNFARVRKAVFMTIGCGMAIGTLGFILGETIPEVIASAFVDSSKGGDEQLMITAAAQGMRIIPIYWQSSVGNICFANTPAIILVAAVVDLASPSRSIRSVELDANCRQCINIVGIYPFCMANTQN